MKKKAVIKISPKSKLPAKGKSDNLKNLRIADLELFIAAAHLKNLGQAATLQHLSQSAASAAIMRVETVFGLQLCTHEKRSFGLTLEGLQLLPRVEAWLRQLRESVVTQDPLPMRIATTHAMARVSIPAILPIENIELKLMRPDGAYGAVLRDEADVAIVLDNAAWEGVIASEIGKGSFQLYSSNKTATERPILLPEDQIEVLTFLQRWQHMYKTALPIKARLPSWSLIADICCGSQEIGFLPEFLAKPLGLHAVAWQPAPSKYRILTLYKPRGSAFQIRLENLLAHLRVVFNAN